ncbi:hypothetical protein [Methanocella conradii]|uniref:hypothetical protein n=1 Tax=Methanocella conradii TaxID=1175444 RepID=UPI0024B35C2A|nr:hypothetical protein [Methanocella conradii]MDI6897106.1 hypothetical protein [Methanocella conradii]
MGGIFLCGVFSLLDMGVFNAQAMNNAEAVDKIISFDDAKEKVRAFIEKPGENVYFKDSVVTPHGKAFELVADNGTFYANAMTGDVELAYFKQDYKGSLGAKLTKGQAQDKALAYAKKYYKNFLKKNMQLVSAEEVDHGDAGKEYTFIWNEKINEIYTPNVVVVSINPGTGEMISYIGIEWPLLVKPELIVSKEDSIDKAIDQFEGISVVEANAEPRIVYMGEGVQKVAWVVEVRGEEKDGWIPGGSVTIDALNGDILIVDPYQ